MQKILEIKNGIARNEAHQLQSPVNFVLRAGESVAISGPNGGGKSLLTGLITGAIPIKTVLPDGQTGESGISGKAPFGASSSTTCTEQPRPPTINSALEPR